MTFKDTLNLLQGSSQEKSGALKVLSVVSQMATAAAALGGPPVAGAAVVLKVATSLANVLQGASNVDDIKLSELFVQSTTDKLAQAGLSADKTAQLAKDAEA